MILLCNSSAPLNGYIIVLERVSLLDNKMYVIMHGEREVAQIAASGYCKVYGEGFMPYDLYLDDTDDAMDTLVNNITNFYYWCATRVLTLDRAYAKEILNSIGASQARTDRERAKIALSYHCLSLTDIYWVKMAGEDVSFKEINLYENHLENALVDIALRGRQMTVNNRHLLADDLSTGGAFPKAWLRKADGFMLLKDGNDEAVENELLASKICRCFLCHQVHYDTYDYEGMRVSASTIMTDIRYSIVSREAFDIYAANHQLDALQYILELDGYSFHMMNILDYLVGNTDRHWGNWGLLIDNETNRPVRLHDLMDFNKAFGEYDTMEGANCLTVYPELMSQQAAAARAVKCIGLNQICAVDEIWFDGRDTVFKMFMDRLAFLKSIDAGRMEH